MTSNEHLFIQGKELFGTGHPQESIAIFSRAVREGCNPVNVLLSRGAAYMITNDLDKSIEDFNRVLEIDTDNERAFYFRGIAHLGKGEFAEAVSDLSESIALNSNRGAAFLARGIAFAEQNHTDESLKDLQIAVSFSNQEVERFSNLFGANRTLFDKSMALLEGDRGPWSIVMTEDEVNKLRKWTEH